MGLASSFSFYDTHMCHVRACKVVSTPSRCVGFQIESSRCTAQRPVLGARVRLSYLTKEGPYKGQIKGRKQKQNKGREHAGRLLALAQLDRARQASL